MVVGPNARETPLERAEAARAAGRNAEAVRLYAEAITRARATGDPDHLTRAALGAAAMQRFGPDPGSLPAVLAEALAVQDDSGARVRLMAALARSWVYAGQSRRAARFAVQALELARDGSDPQLLGDALDAALTTRWGPDELESRSALAQELDEVTAHLLDPDARIQAHLWGLTVALERLDAMQMSRQVRALELLGEESPRARFFAATRRLTLDLLRGRVGTADRLLRTAERAAAESSVPDAEVVLQALTAYVALYAGDPQGCALAAEQAESLAEAEGLLTVAAEAGPFWVAAGRLDRAGALVQRFEGRTLADLARDMDWLLVLQCVLRTALATGQPEAITQIVPLLTPYTGRGVVNGGAFMFHGVPDDLLSRAHALLGDAAAADRLWRSAGEAYQRAGAHWWAERLARPAATVPAPDRAPPDPVPAVFRRTQEGGWEIGRVGRTVRLPDLRGLGYLHALLSRPGLEMPAVDLVGIAGRQAVVLQPGLDAPLDETARRAFRSRLQDLDAELEEAREWADISRVEQLEAERDALLAELGSAFGLGGRARHPGSTVERARVAVRKALVAALDHLAVADPVTARHLRSHVTTGMLCGYRPDPDAPWSWTLG